MAHERVALVTGGGRGIGKGIALALGSRGWTVIVNYHSNAAAAETTLQEVVKAGGQGKAFQADIGQVDQHQPLVDSILSTYGRIDILVNNAGMAPRQRMDILDTSEGSYDELMRVNLKGPFFLTQLISRKMIELRGQIDSPFYIVNIGSISSYTSSINRAEYCLSKAGMTMMTRLFADRLAEYNILVYEISPGVIATDMTHAVTEKYDRLIDEGLTPIRRWGQPDDVGKAVVAIAEGFLPFSTGEIINVDGGFHLHRL